MASNFKYASQEDLTKYFNRVSDYGGKRQIFNWKLGYANLGDPALDYYYANSSGFVDELFWNGAISNKLSMPKTSTTTVNAELTSIATSCTAVDTGSLETYDIVKIGNGSNAEYVQVGVVSSGTVFLIAKRGLFGTSPTKHISTTAIVKVVDESVVHSIQGVDATEEYPFWVYDDDQDTTILLIDTDTTTDSPSDHMVEAGYDFLQFCEQTLTDASLELHNYLDARYSTPIEKSKQIDIDNTALSVAEEYDPIIIKSVCYIAAANLIRAKEGSSEEADYYYSLVTNPESTGLIDKLNDGIYKLSNEVDANDKKGKIKYRELSGSMDIVELEGQYYGEGYDLLKVEIEATGAYGTGTFKVHYLSNDQLFGATTSAEKITGGLQHIYGGLYGRFQGASATDGDIWEIEVYGSHRKQTNKSNATIEMTR